jgi:hypothetical protein
VVARRSPSHRYYFEEVQVLERDYGFTGIYRSGLRCTPPTRVAAGGESLGARRHSGTTAARGFERQESALKDGAIPGSPSDWRQPFDVGDVARGGDLGGVDGGRAQIGDTGKAPLKAIAWTERRVTDVVKVGTRAGAHSL